ncbi:MAG: di-trans,poly-cis-decaprenylcistransferase [Candidatus Doudnabacteria bacterium RIFCSPHIGHO2_01_FULL_50_11]|uniref:Di-trans,poly-cis-decaprenylcistransferase n=1 Tax=Candidatus Doudnabacteria bacterium RIFCSPHIGHO2_01_FULL_50_11 TaxID=1817828 RepID=A0A1F5PIW7_9BACT|nr:MAG: di-trans,poly-cis-decaprenylcistransferase [Candidatus Doudnabacteria bacterium RIFCSPHIGHO2_01_FULL_50_11]HLC44610.1 polyprenyl diphosphate synthase [Patescibacteria group bacterium]
MKTNDSKAPLHFAVIPDGNRRWAKSRGLKPWLGHKSALERFQEVFETAYDAGTRYLTFWAGSEDNLRKRDAMEVKFLVEYMADVLTNEANVRSLVERRTRARIIGRWHDIVPNTRLKEAIETLEQRTKEFSDSYLTILFGYDGKSEMLAAVGKLRDDNIAVTAEALKTRLWTGFLPPVDLVLRTGGEPHWSAGFMMWLTADSQFFFTDMLWPEVTRQTIKDIFADYAGRGRRFGK